MSDNRMLERHAKANGWYIKPVEECRELGDGSGYDLTLFKLFDVYGQTVRGQSPRDALRRIECLEHNAEFIEARFWGREG